MKQGWRWFGAADTISLKEIRQAGATEIVTALHQLKCGELWTVAEIQKRVDEVKNAGMTWSVVESVPVHEAIKTNHADAPKYLEIYCQSLRNLAQCGVKTVCYNFMPILDWTRTQLDFPQPDGSTVLHCDATAIALFDLYILKRPQAERDYTAAELVAAEKKFAAMNAAEIEKLTAGILLGLPGTVDDLTLSEFQQLLNSYQNIDARQLKENLFSFLNHLAPLCQELGIKMAIHPDDPPRAIFGLPRIMSTLDDILEMFTRVPEKNIGLTLCAGSLGGRPENEVVEIFQRCRERIYFAHFRNINYVDARSFHEANHLTGKVNMPLLMQALIDEETRRGEEIVVRPDHGKFMEIDKVRKCYAGYAYGGRLVGLAELRGLEMGLKAQLTCAGQNIVITGGAGVLCSVMTADLLRRGANVAIVDLRADVAQAFAEKMAAQGLTQTLAIGANVLDKNSLIAAKEKILAAWGKIDVLINGAGGNHPQGTCAAEQMTADTPIADSFFGLQIEGFEWVNKLNFIGTLLPAQVFGEAMLAHGGCLVNISSMSATQPLTKVAAYSAAKAAIDNFTRWLATHLAPMNIRVNAIAPGFFITEQNRFLMLEKDEKTLTARGRKVIHKTPMRKFGEPTDLCAAVRFLISPTANFITGIVVPVDGGFLAYSGV